MPGTDTATAIPCSAAKSAAGGGDRLLQSDVDRRRPQGGDEAAHLVEPLAQHVAQEGELRAGGLRRVVDHPIEVLDLEDGVGQDLGRAVVDLLGEPLALPLLGLDDPQRDGGGRQLGLGERRLARGRVVAGEVVGTSSSCRARRCRSASGAPGRRRAHARRGRARCAANRRCRGRCCHPIGGRCWRGARSNRSAEPGTARGSARPSRACAAPRGARSRWPRRTCVRTSGRRWDRTEGSTRAVLAAPATGGYGVRTSTGRDGHAVGRVCVRSTVLRAPNVLPGECARAQPARVSASR